jgi:hypothetical protein
LDKLAELISQKLAHLEEQLFTVNCDLTVISYNPTYADTYVFKKPPKKSLNTHFLRQFLPFFIICFVRLQRSLTHNELLSFTRNFAFGGKKNEKTKSKIFELVSLGGSSKSYLLQQFRRYSFVILHLKAQALFDNSLESFFLKL